jgi:hypothetical protein
MNRRHPLIQAGAAAVLPFLGPSCTTAPRTVGAPTAPFRRVRPSDPAWPGAASWEQLNRQVGGQLIKVESPLTACASAPQGARCKELFSQLKNPSLVRHDRRA